MGLLSMIGRFLFGSFFMLSAWLRFNKLITNKEVIQREYAVKMAGPLNLVLHPKVSESDRMEIVSNFLGAFIGFKALGGCLLIFNFILSVPFLAIYLLAEIPFFCGFYHYKVGEPEFMHLLQDFVHNVSFFGALMFFTEMKLIIMVRTRLRDQRNSRVK